MSSKSKIEVCILEIREWMSANRLVLNDAKTEILHFHSKFRDSSDFNSLLVGEDEISASQSVISLGFHFDSVCSLSSHIAAVCKSASFALHRIGLVRRFLNRTSTVTAIVF
ncbi:hypothetical protein SNE40_003471 [Patella caerulea]|uniref:Uncharacterized protein n=1 Tax=Patella caerulea TaxID=87958 RepID=A0AAN8KAT5_PATCE